MPDYYVKNLQYSLKLPDHISYRSPAPVTWDTDIFRAHLREGRLVCEMKKDFSLEEDARHAAEPLLHAWEISAGLDIAVGALHFEYQCYVLGDRNPAPPEPGYSAWSDVLAVTPRAEVVAPPTKELVPEQYPVPPTDFAASPDVEVMWLRYRMYKEGREPLPAMAYFCLTVVEQSAFNCLTPGKARNTRNLRPEATKKYMIDPPVLRTLGDLSSERGDETSARKRTDPKAWQPLTDNEQKWMEKAVQILIRRLGEFTAGKSLTKITLGDLPPL